MGHDPFSPLGPDSQATPDGGPQSPRRREYPAQTDQSDLGPIGPASGQRASRFEAEVERLRRAPREAASTFSSGVPWMGIFSRTRDIIAANFNDLLDKADDPEKMIRMIIFEMEETLVEVRASAARTIADQKEMHRHTVKLDQLQADWADKAQLALSKGREDLARAALVEKKKAAIAEMEAFERECARHAADMIPHAAAALEEARARAAARSAARVRCTAIARGTSCAREPLPHRAWTCPVRTGSWTTAHNRTPGHAS